MFNITNILRKNLYFDYCFLILSRKNSTSSVNLVVLFTVLASKICQKTNIFACTLIFLAKPDDFC